MPLDDGANTTKEQLNNVVETLRKLINEGNVVLVHCMAGISRSATVVAVYLAQEWKCPWAKAILHVKSCRSIVHPNDVLVVIAKEMLGE
jgi:atypical dual specificity phosphatase